jgi:hypothetical protein
MQAPRSSGPNGLPPEPGGRPKGMRLSSLHVGISAFAALAGVIFAAIQTFSTDNSSPINVTLSVDPVTGAKLPSNMDVAKTGGANTVDAVNISAKGNGAAGGPAIELAALNLDSRTQITSALKDGEGHYLFGDLFDGRPETFVTIEAPETELNVMVELPSVQTIGGIEYTPPRDAGNLARAAVLDVMVLPEGQLEGSGRPVMSFALQTSPGSQSFALSEKSLGKGLWLRIAGPAGAGNIAVGDFKILKAIR